MAAAWQIPLLSYLLKIRIQTQEKMIFGSCRIHILFFSRFDTNPTANSFWRACRPSRKVSCPVCRVNETSETYKS